MPEYIGKAFKKEAKMRTFLMSLVLLTAVGFAQEITGAFGIRFGTPLKDIKIIKAMKTVGGNLIYLVSPSEKVNGLDTYIVEAEPKNNRVYGIWGVKRGISKEKCVNTLEEFSSKIEKEYEIKRQKPPFNVEGYFFTKGDKTIIVKCLKDKTGWSFYIQYYDESLVR